MCTIHDSDFLQLNIHVHMYLFATSCVQKSIHVLFNDFSIQHVLIRFNGKTISVLCLCTMLFIIYI